MWPPFLDEDIKDLRIICTDGDTHGSSLLLAVASPFLCHLMDNIEDQVLILPGTNLDSVEALLCLVHFGTACVSLEDQAEDVIRLAEALNLPSLTQDHDKLPPLIQNQKLPILTQYHNENESTELHTCESRNTEKMQENQTLAPLQSFETNYKKSTQHTKLKRTPNHIENLAQGIIKRKWVKKTKCHPCQVCDKAFFSKAQLQDHVKKHEGSPGYCCDSCGKAFYRKDCLTIHTKSVHFGERKFTCQTCGKKFINNYKLERHLKTHTILTAGRKVQRKQVAPVSLLKVELFDTYR